MRSLPNPTDVWSLDDARRIFDEWRRSGASLAAFARRHRYAVARLYWWKRRLATEPVVSRSWLEARAVNQLAFDTGYPYAAGIWDDAAIAARVFGAIAVDPGRERSTFVSRFDSSTARSFERPLPRWARASSTALIAKARE